MYNVGDMIHIVAPKITAKAQILAIIPKFADLNLSNDYKMVFGLKPQNNHRAIVDHHRYIAIAKDDKGDKYFLVPEKHIYGKAKK
jgi:hypothetical protein